MSAAKGFVSRAASAVKSFASKALAKAKEMGTKALTAAKNAATKAATFAADKAKAAFSKAKRMATTAFNKAKQLGTKAVSGVKSLASKAFAAAKSLGSRAIAGAKKLAATAAAKAKSLGAKAWSGIKSAGSKAWDFAKAAGAKGVDLAKAAGRKAAAAGKALGLDKAWAVAKDIGGKALKTAGSAVKSVGKRFGPVLKPAAAIAGKVGSLAMALSPAALACKTIGCCAPKLTKQGSARTQAGTDLATDILPGVSTVKDGCACITGQNVVTGESVDGAVRAVSCAAAAVDVASLVAAPFTGGASVAGGMAAKAALKGAIKVVIKKGGKELGEKGAKELAEQGSKETVQKGSKESSEKELKRSADEAVAAGGRKLEPGVKAQSKLPGGEHTAKVLDDGRLIVCSSCAPVRNLIDGIDPTKLDAAGKKRLQVLRDRLEAVEKELAGKARPTQPSQGADQADL